MLSTLSTFAIDFHMSLKAERLFSIGSFNVTNSMVWGLITSSLLVAILVRAGVKASVKPSRGLNGIIEWLTEFVIKTIESPLGSREAAMKYAPYFGVYFFFVIATNLLGLLPLVGPNIYTTVAGEHVPLLRPFTADLNSTIAMSIFAVGMVQYLSIKQQGIKNYVRHYFPGKVYNPIELFMGLLEIVGEFTKIASLSLRLFLNTAVGEILIAVFTSIVYSQGRTPLLVLPILLFEILVAAVQAYVYIILCASYLGVSVERHAAKNGDQLTVMSKA